MVQFKEKNPSKKMSNSTTTSTPAKAATQDTVAGQSMNEDEEKPILRGQVVDTTGSRNRAWLVKVPMQLAEQWHSGAADAILGRVEIAPPQRGTQQTRPRITVVDQSGHVYSCESLERPPMYVISRKRKVRSDDDGGGGGGDDEEDDEEEDSDADLDEEIPMDASAAAAPRSYGAAIYASVEQSLSLTPQLTQAYSREFGKRLRREEERRKMLVVSDDIVPRGVRAAPIVSQRAGTTTTAAAAAAAAAMAPPPRVVAAPVRMRKEPEQRAERMDKDKLHTLLLSLFSRKERWRLVELRGVVNQPMEWLKENLAEITVFNTRGMHKGTYELKEEYRIKEGTTDAQAAAAADDEERAQEKEASADEEWV